MMFIYYSQSLLSALVLLVRSTFQITLKLLVQHFISSLILSIYARYSRYLKRVEIANTMAFPTVAPAFIIRTFNSLVFITLFLRVLATSSLYYYELLLRLLFWADAIEFAKNKVCTNEISFQMTFTFSFSKSI